MGIHGVVQRNNKAYMLVISSWDLNSSCLYKLQADAFSSKLTASSTRHSDCRIFQTEQTPSDIKNNLKILSNSYLLLDKLKINKRL